MTELETANSRIAELEAQLAAMRTGGAPVAWHTEDHLTDRSATTYSKDMMYRWLDKGWPVTPLYTHPRPAAPLEDGFTLVAVKGFDDLMYWLDRCESKGHLENCSDLIEPWENFEYRAIAAQGEKE